MNISCINLELVSSELMVCTLPLPPHSMQGMQFIDLPVSLTIVAQANRSRLSNTLVVPLYTGVTPPSCSRRPRLRRSLRRRKSVGDWLYCWPHHHRDGHQLSANWNGCDWLLNVTVLSWTALTCVAPESDSTEPLLVTVIITNTYRQTIASSPLVLAIVADDGGPHDERNDPS